MKLLSVRLKESFSRSHLTTLSTNIKTHTQRHACIQTQFTEVVYTGTAILSDVWMTAYPLNPLQIPTVFFFLQEKNGLMEEDR